MHSWTLPEILWEQSLQYSQHARICANILNNTKSISNINRPLQPELALHVLYSVVVVVLCLVISIDWCVWDRNKELGLSLLSYKQVVFSILIWRWVSLILVYCYCFCHLCALLLITNKYIQWVFELSLKNIFCFYFLQLYAKTHIWTLFCSGFDGKSINVRLCIYLAGLQNNCTHIILHFLYLIFCVLV